MTTEYIEPTEEQVKIMQDYADLCSKALDMISQFEVNNQLQNASSRLQESLHWFQSSVINGSKLKVADTVN